jgi:hypothetical protein
LTRTLLGPSSTEVYQGDAITVVVTSGRVRRRNSQRPESRPWLEYAGAKDDYRWERSVITKHPLTLELSSDRGNPCVPLFAEIVRSG